MPSCRRFAVFAIVLGGAGFLTLLTLAELIQPVQREMTESIVLRARTGENPRIRASVSKPAAQTVSLYQSLQGLPLSSR